MEVASLEPMNQLWLKERDEGGLICSEETILLEIDGVSKLDFDISLKMDAIDNYYSNRSYKQRRIISFFLNFFVVLDSKSGMHF